MRLLITGAGGFVGRHVRSSFEADGHQVVGIGLHPEPGVDRVVDVTDSAAVIAAIQAARPDAVLHLAGSASVAESAKNPALALRVNTGGTLNVCTGVLALKSPCRLLLVSSGEVYGAASGSADATESTTCDPINVYGATKLAAEVIARQQTHLGLDVILARPFNHLGAGQHLTFVLPSFAQQLARVPRGASVTLEVGNLSAVRDFSHVDDVVDAYRLLLEKGKRGDVYNIGSGLGQSIEQLLQALIAISGRSVSVRVDPARLRPVEIPRLVSDASKLRSLGWTPRRSVEQALREVMEEHEHR